MAIGVLPQIGLIGGEIPLCLDVSWEAWGCKVLNNHCVVG